LLWSNVTAEAGKNHGGWPDIRAKKFRKELEDAGEHKEHSRFKQHGNEVHFNVACANWKVVQAIELHKWREHGHQHDQDEHDFWHLARHKSSLAAPWKQAPVA
jgi:hypothetical protein